ncbi:ABC transporter ATP-binding protein [Candidatus Omnitrophota bacterium]
MSKTILEVNNISKYFSIKRGFLKRSIGAIKAVDGVTFALQQQETLGLVGESGCGKTTLAQLIIRLLTPDSGDIIFNGENISCISQRKLKTHRRSMQIVFQDPYSSLDPLYRTKDIIAEAFVSAKETSREEREERIQELLKLVLLPKNVLNRYPHEFSGGERQRIAIARSLAVNPQLLILDEAVSNLDVVIQAQILSLLAELQKKLKLTYLFISHNLRVIKKVSTKVAVMYQGKIVEMATTDELFHQSIHPYTRALLAAALEMKSAAQKEVVALPREISGCQYHPRCPYAQAICRKNVPELRENETGHYVACHFPMSSATVNNI